MPNTPVMIGQGMTVAVDDVKISAPLRNQIETLLQTTGDFFRGCAMKMNWMQPWPSAVPVRPIFSI